MDAAVAPLLRRKRRPPSAPCFRLQPWQLHANLGDAQEGRAVVADRSAREIDQDRRPGVRTAARSRSRWPRSRYRGRCSRNSDPHRPVAGTARTSVRGAEVRSDRQRRQRCALTKVTQQVLAPRGAQTRRLGCRRHPPRANVVSLDAQKSDYGARRHWNPGNVDFRRQEDPCRTVRRAQPIGNQSFHAGARVEGGLRRLFLWRRPHGLPCASGTRLPRLVRPRVIGEGRGLLQLSND